MPSCQHCMTFEDAVREVEWCELFWADVSPVHL